MPSLGVDDLKGLDLKGKIAVIFGGAPAEIHGPLRAYFRTAAIRWQKLKDAGAVGLITIPEPRPQSAASPQRSGAPGSQPANSITQLSDPALNPLEGLRLNATVPVASAAALFAGSPHPFDELQNLKKDGRPLPTFSLAVTIRATTATQVASSFQSPNVVGLLEGSDSN